MDFTLTLTQANQLASALRSYGAAGDTNGLSLFYWHLVDQLTYSEDEALKVTVMDHEVRALRTFVYDLHDFTWLYDALS